MPDIVRFKSGSKDSLLGTTGTNALPLSAGTVYFAVDANNKGYLYFDKDSTHRIWMGMSEEAQKATRDGANNIIADTYIPKTIGTAKGDIIYWSAANTPARLAAGSNGQVLKINSSGVPAWAADSNSDTKVKLTSKTDNVEYPVVLGPNSITSGTAYEAFYNSNIKVNPSTGTITATNFAGTATKATQDGAGNVIVDTYIQKGIGTAKGDIIYWSASGTPARLAIGSNGQVLKVNSSGLPVWSSDSNTDTKVKLTSTTTTNTGNYALVLGPTSITSGSAYEANYNTGIYATPSDTSITAALFHGKADSATKDGADNVITDTYIPKAIGTAKGDMIYWSASGTPTRLAASTNGKVLKLVNGVPAWDNDIDVDIKVSLTSMSTAGSYPLMFGPTTINSGTAYEAYYNTGIKVDPSTKTITASYFDGIATKASQDGAGNVIVDTYISKTGTTGDILYWSNTNTPAHLAKGTDGQVLKLSGGVPTWSTDNNSDTKVTQAAPITTNANYPILLGYNNTSTTTAYTNTVNRTGTGVYINPSTNTIVATSFDGVATKASADGAGNVIVDTYAKKDGSNATGTWPVSISGNAATASIASKISDINTNDVASSTATWRRVWFSYNDNTTGRPAYSDSFAYQTSTGTLKATVFQGNLSGNADTATKATNDAAGNDIQATYAASFSISDHTITLKNKNGSSLGTVTVPDNDTKNTAGSTQDATKIYIVGAKSQAANAQTYSSSKVYITDGTVTATTFAGKATSAGSADTATKATQDGSGNVITSTYLKDWEWSPSGYTDKIVLTKGDNTKVQITNPWLALTGGSVTGPVNFGDSVNIEDLTVGELVCTGIGRFVNGLIGNLTGDVTGNATSATSAIYDATGTQRIDSTYVKSASVSGTTITFTRGDNSTFTVTTQDNNTDTKVTNTLGTTTKAYITGTTSASTNTGTQIFDTGVYLSTTAGELVATKFTGALNGNAATATKASQDGAGNNIVDTYVNKTGAKGDILYWSGTDTVAHLSASTDGKVLKLSSGVPVWSDDNNSDTKVTQTAVTASGYTNWRPIIWGASNSGTEGFTPSTTTDGVFTTNTLSVQPSTGTIRATTFKGTATNATADAAGNPFENYIKEVTATGRTITVTKWNQTSTDYNLDAATMTIRRWTSA